MAEGAPTRQARVHVQPPLTDFRFRCLFPVREAATGLEVPCHKEVTYAAFRTHVKGLHLPHTNPPLAWDREMYQTRAVRIDPAHEDRNARQERLLLAIAQRVGAVVPGDREGDGADGGVDGGADGGADGGNGAAGGDDGETSGAPSEAANAVQRDESAPSAASAALSSAVSGVASLVLAASTEGQSATPASELPSATKKRGATKKKGKKSNHAPAKAKKPAQAEVSKSVRRSTRRQQ